MKSSAVSPKRRITAAGLWAMLAACLSLAVSARAADLPAWNQVAQGSSVLSLAADAQGRMWVGTEGHGLWRGVPGGAWTHWTVQDGLGDADGRALAVDHQGRVWTGHESEGVSVFDGRRWQNYNAITGPLGGHVFALAVCPTDGSVWMATSLGLARYRPAGDTWAYYTRLDGLPSDQANALAFGADGTLYVGTQCDGIAVGSAADDYKAWRVVSGPMSPPIAAEGDGLPSPNINCLLAARGGTVFAGTTAGLAWSRDIGRTWRFARGADWEDKARGLAHPPAFLPSSAATAPPAEDAVTALAEDSQNTVWIGYRTTGVEAMDARGGGDTPLGNNSAGIAGYGVLRSVITAGFVQAIQPLPDGKMSIGFYGKGLMTAQTTAAPVVVMPLPNAPPVPLPAPASAPSAEQMAALTHAAQRLSAARTPGSGAFLGDDWATQGDWVGRYGRQYAVLCGMKAPADHVFSASEYYGVEDTIGPHHQGSSSPYSYVFQRETADRRALYTPLLGHRRQSEWNDGSFDENKYPATYDGPDLWLAVTVPAGAQRVSLYFVNKDGHSGRNQVRDYTLELKAPALTVDAAEGEPTLARARVQNFWGGVYKQFAVQGPGQFWIKIERGGSHVTILQGVMIDTLGPAPHSAPPAANSADQASTERPWLGLAYSPLKGIGLQIIMVVPDGPAERAELKKGDILFSMDNVHVTQTGPGRLSAVLDRHRPGDTLPLVVSRGGRRLTLSVTLGAVTTTRIKGMFFNRPIPLPLGGIVYAPPAYTPLQDTTNQAAQGLWTTLDKAQAQAGGETLAERGRVLAYRALFHSQASPAQRENWRWALPLWTAADQANFAQIMAQAWQAQLKLTPDLSDPRSDTSAHP